MAIKIDVSFDNGNIVDKCNNIWLTTGNVAISTRNTKWHNESMKGNPQTNLHTNTPINLDFGTGDFTVEAWVFSASKDQNGSVLQISDKLGGLKNSSTQSIALGGYYNYINDTYFTESNQPENSWSHKAIVRFNGVFYCYINGRIIYTEIDTGVNYNVKYAVIGNYYDNNYAWNGYIDSVRVANHAIYKSNFTPTKLVDTKHLFIAQDKKVYSA